MKLIDKYEVIVLLFHCSRFFKEELVLPGTFLRQNVFLDNYCNTVAKQSTLI